ncbi:reverse transcriptase domain-containing protein [Paenibacillus macquariensis]|uniref:Reverse transcriptase (RNA-dependent DNA polymerase) n=1 Tax=Paenibacillus macquariensis TaxID=948756 RepID=A0ABY1KDZ4_9BACL|nr:reverse transcriptase domain-containing protein [Paenibacillus macquariensis]MEC0093152.1 reverse transcriptase domain-containing protein [Paenibacillus macquariensis]OAB29918.1 hypothetical protein PMSM_23570 [Paenibacillus macquariensis subsp. macquariensis]SIR68475.1 Reverse transcriptase (RNA-dependent DNA polymerase) [Paenibacillus macquariensis]
MENGTVVKNEEGVPQGGSLSPLLANIYLHYTLDLWFTKAVKKHCQGEAYIVRYADDFVACFQYKHDAEMFYEALGIRLAKFSLQVAEEKTKILTFGRYAERDVKKEAGRKPQTFDFLGFTHYCGRSRKGRFKLKWKTSRKKYHTRIQEFKEWIQENRKLSLSEIWKAVNLKLRGHYQYYGSAIIGTNC